MFEFHVYNCNLVFLFEFHYLSKNEEETKKVVDEEEYKGMFVNFYFDAVNLKAFSSKNKTSQKVKIKIRIKEDKQLLVSKKCVVYVSYPLTPRSD